MELSIMSTIASYQSISAEAHGDLRIKSNVGYRHLAQMNNSLILAEEIAEIASSLPVVFLQDEDAGRFQLSAFSFQLYMLYFQMKICWSMNKVNGLLRTCLLA